MLPTCKVSSVHGSSTASSRKDGFTVIGIPNRNVEYVPICSGQDFGFAEGWSASGFAYQNQHGFSLRPSGLVGWLVGWLVAPDTTVAVLITLLDILYFPPECHPPYLSGPLKTVFPSILVGVFATCMARGGCSCGLVWIWVAVCGKQIV